MEEVDDQEAPQYFLCPISLQIMKDPVTAATGITYDRESIEHWLKTAPEPVCPVTKQRLPRVPDLTPNHTLRRLIQAWCVANAKERFPTPKAPLARAHVIRLLRRLLTNVHPGSLDQILALATATATAENKKVLAECGAPKAMVTLIMGCYKERKTEGLDQAMRILTSIWASCTEMEAQIEENFDDLVNSLTWVINETTLVLQNLAILLIKEILKVASSNLIDKLKPDFFKSVVKVLSQRHNNNSNTSVGPTKAALRVLLAVCQQGRNKYKIIEANAISEIIELELGQSGPPAHPEKKKISELGFCLLAQLCTCADGRAQFLAHAGGIAVVSKRILRVSPVVDDRAVHILALIAKYSATKEVLQEMLGVGGVSKLCMVLQANSAKYLKDKVREILRMHSHVWNNSPCIQVYLLTRYPMLQF